MSEAPQGFHTASHGSFAWGIPSSQRPMYATMDVTARLNWDGRQAGCGQCVGSIHDSFSDFDYLKIFIYII